MDEDEKLDEQTAGAFGTAAKNADDAVPTSPVPQMQALAQRCLAVIADKWARQAKGN